MVTLFGLAYLISWTVWLPLYGHIFDLQGLPVLPFHHGIGALGPLLAAVVTTSIYGKKGAVKELAKNCFKARPLIYPAIALLSPFVIAVMAMLAGYLINGSAIEMRGLLHNKEFPAFSLPVFIIYNIAFFGFGEEVGWRGFALPRLQGKMNALSASLLLTAFWAVWHWPLFFYRPGYTHMDMAGIAGWVMSLVTGSVLLSWLYNSTRGSILICAVFHACIDIPFTADIADKNVAGYMGFIITLWGILTIVIFKPKNLSRRERVVDASE